MYGNLKRLVCLLVLVGALTLAGCGMHHHEQRRMECDNCPMKGRHGGMAMAAPMAADQAAQRHDLLYVCNCGPECKCNSVATAPGNCKCGKPLVAYHVVKVEGDEALLCTCGGDCKCAIDPADSSKCGCGNPVKRVSLKGSGIYFCNCGGSCFCNTVSDQPGNCKCGMPLKKVD